MSHRHPKKSLGQHYLQDENIAEKIAGSLKAINIEHVIEVTGNANHVGLGSDFDGISSTPEGLENVGKLSAITKELTPVGIMFNLIILSSCLCFLEFVN